ncbi:MAG TPA: TolC family protein [Longimicrobiales bacterium]|nr:TolC family protein [Longimicrobiales bacterium]
MAGNEEGQVSRVVRGGHWVVALLLAVPVGLAGQAPPLTLADALARADRGAFANRIAEGTAEAQSAPKLAALKGILPSLRVEGGYVRTTDPIGAFGTALRQRTITQADFDPRRLNYPSAVGNYGASLVLEQPLLNVDAHLGRVAAARAADAADATTEWTHATTRLEVVRAYYGAVLAAERVATLEAAARAAEAHVRQADAVVRAGLATRSDELLAQVKAGEVEAALVGARGDASLALRQLALLLGTPGDTTIAVPGELPAPDRVRQASADESPRAEPERRGDVAAARLSLSAAQTDVLRARSLYLPRLNAFGRYDWNSASRPWGGEKNWTVGIMASWSPFAGASELAELRAAGGREAAARAGAEAADARARLEVEQAENARRVALRRLEIAERATLQSGEAHRIVARKYDGGLATVQELLDAAAIETQTRLGLSAAVYDAVVAEAARRQALGLDVAALTALETGTQRTN